MWYAWVIVVFICNFMKSSAVYEASSCILRFDTLIWPSIRFDISVKNFKKPLVDITSPKIEKTFQRIFSYNFGCKKKA